MNVKHVKLMLLAGVALFGLLLITGASVGSALLLAMVLACPLMMLFMMGGGHGGQGQGTDDRRAPGNADDETHAHRRDV